MSASPRLPSRTFAKKGRSRGKYIRQTGGSGNYGHCKLRVEPNTPGAGYEIPSRDQKSGSVPKEYIKAESIRACRDALELGHTAGSRLWT